MKWAKKYAETKDFIVIGVHTPETEEEKVKSNVFKYVKDHKIDFPVVIDGDQKIWNSWQIRFWPSTLLIDKKGNLRGKWEGELDWQNSGVFKEVERSIEMLQKEKGPAKPPEKPV